MSYLERHCRDYKNNNNNNNDNNNNNNNNKNNAFWCLSMLQTEGSAKNDWLLLPFTFPGSYSYATPHATGSHHHADVCTRWAEAVWHEELDLECVQETLCAAASNFSKCRQPWKKIKTSWRHDHDGGKGGMEHTGATQHTRTHTHITLDGVQTIDQVCETFSDGQTNKILQAKPQMLRRDGGNL
eukprot:5931158-Amphidinium_carterae.1